MAKAGTSFSALLLTLICGLVQAGQPATTLSDVPLRSAPFLDADTLIQLSKDTPIEITGRKGGWYQVATPEHTGWLKLYSVRLNKSEDAMQKDADTGIEAAGNLLFTGRSGSNDTSASTGIRGLDEEDLNTATPDDEALERMEPLKPTANGVDKFQSRRQLRSSQIEYFNKIEIETQEVTNQNREPSESPHKAQQPLGNDYD